MWGQLRRPVSVRSAQSPSQCEVSSDAQSLWGRLRRPVNARTVRSWRHRDQLRHKSEHSQRATISVTQLIPDSHIRGTSAQVVIYFESSSAVIPGDQNYPVSAQSNSHNANLQWYNHYYDKYACTYLGRKLLNKSSNDSLQPVIIRNCLESKRGNSFKWENRDWDKDTIWETLKKEKYL
jgi:hypothetical protein